MSRDDALLAIDARASNVHRTQCDITAELQLMAPIRRHLPTVDD
jgi:hypothetical protein